MAGFVDTGGARKQGSTQNHKSLSLDGIGVDGNRLKPSD